jgi:hypothetical protein
MHRGDLVGQYAPSLSTPSAASALFSWRRANNETYIALGHASGDVEILLLGEDLWVNPLFRRVTVKRAALLPGATAAAALAAEGSKGKKGQGGSNNSGREEGAGLGPVLHLSALRRGAKLHSYVSAHAALFFFLLSSSSYEKHFLVSTDILSAHIHRWDHTTCDLHAVKPK